MERFLTLLQDIEKRPHLYLRHNSLLLLKTFFDGYMVNEFTRGSDVCDSFMNGFQEYIADFYNDRRTLSWYSIINEHSPTADDPLEVFFKHFHDYCAKSLPLDRNNLSGEE